MAIPGWLAHDPRVVCVRHRDALDGQCAEWPTWLPGAVRDAVTGAGIERPWLHQVMAADAAWAGQHVAVSTASSALDYIVVDTAEGAQRCIEYLKWVW